MKNNNLLFLFLVAFYGTISSQDIFNKIDAANFQYKIKEQPKKFEQFQLNTAKLLNELGKTSERKSEIKIPIILSLPNGLGGFENFEIFEAPILNRQLSKKYPTIKSYIGRSTKSSSTIRFSYSPSQGFNALISNNKSATILIKPSSLKNELTLTSTENMEVNYEIVDWGYKIK